MSSILTNNSAMVALGVLRRINNDFAEMQTRISTGLKIRSAKDNAAYFAISKKMEGDSGMYKSINESLTLSKNSIATSRMGAEQIVELTKKFSERVAFAQGDTVDKAEIGKELKEMVSQIRTTIEQSSFNGHSLIKRSSSDMTVVTGISRTNGFDVTSFDVSAHNLSDLVTNNGSGGSGEFDTNLTASSEMNFTGAEASTLGAGQYNLDSIADALINHSTTAVTTAQMGDWLKVSERAMSVAISAATDLGVKEKTIETQQDFLVQLTDQIDLGIGAMVDADMEKDAARFQAIQVQQQLAIQSLSIANQRPQLLLSLFR